MNKQLQQEFDAFAAVYDQVTLGELQYDAHKRIPAEMLKLYSPSHASVLDLGCGTGLSSKLFFEKGYSLTGVDISPEMLKLAQNYPYSELVCGDLEGSSWQTAEKQFDFISCIGVMEFIKDPAAFLKNCQSRLRANGLIGITFPLNCYSEATIPVYAYQPEQALRLLQEQGFHVKEMVLFTGYFMPEEDISYLGIIADYPFSIDQ